MALLKWELRKIWRPGILAAILVLGAVYYWMFPQFYIEHFTNGPQSQAQFALASGWVERYGPALEPEERAELDYKLQMACGPDGEGERPEVRITYFVPDRKKAASASEVFPVPA